MIGQAVGYDGDPVSALPDFEGFGGGGLIGGGGVCLEMGESAEAGIGVAPGPS